MFLLFVLSLLFLSVFLLLILLLMLRIEICWAVSTCRRGVSGQSDAAVGIFSISLTQSTYDTLETTSFYSKIIIKTDHDHEIGVKVEFMNYPTRVYVECLHFKAIRLRNDPSMHISHTVLKLLCIIF